MAAISGGYGRELAMAHMLRCLFYLEAKFDMRSSLRKVPGVDDEVADAFSRNMIDLFFKQFPQAGCSRCSGCSSIKSAT